MELLRVKISRREFLSQCLKSALVIFASSMLKRDFLSFLKGEKTQEILKNAPTARFFEKLTERSDCSLCHSKKVSNFYSYHKKNSVICIMCAHNCLIEDGKRGRCKARLNINGELKSLVYGRPITTHIDPIEKKPFYHFLPGSFAFSLATSGCPFNCKYCQNWEISQASPEDYYSNFIPPQQIANRTKYADVPVIAYTYNEPTVFSEYLLDIAREGKKLALRSVIISCGFMGEKVLDEMIEVLDAFKIDLKGFSEDFYRKINGGELKPVLNNIKKIAKSKKHLEIVNLVVPTLNDKEEEIKNLSKFVLNETGADTPLHFTRFHPDYQLLNLPPTPVSTLEKAREIALNIGLKYVYIGNVPGHKGNHTYCPKCGNIIIERESFFVRKSHIREGKCSFCSEPIKGVFK